MERTIDQRNATEPDAMLKEITEVDVSDIIDEEPDPDERSFDKEFARCLAEEIEIDGLLSFPVLERRNDGKYEVRDGRHRIYACRDVLGWQKIPCRVLSDVSADMRESIKLAANLFRKPLEDAQSRRAIGQLFKLYEKRCPATTEKGRRRHGEGFAKVLERILGISQGHAQRVATTAEHMPKDKFDALDDAGVPPTQIDQVAAIKEPEAIDETVKLIASGVNPKEAVRRGKKVKAEKQAAAAKQPASPSAPAEPKSERGRRLPAPSDLTDEEWLNENCANILRLLRHKSAFKADAIVYRRAGDTLIKFRGAMKKIVAEGKSQTGNGGFFGAMSRLIRASHPSEWLVCGQCKGTGTVEAAKDETLPGGITRKQCDMCFGAAYRLKLEDY